MIPLYNPGGAAWACAGSEETEQHGFLETGAAGAGGFRAPVRGYFSHFFHGIHGHALFSAVYGRADAAHELCGADGSDEPLGACAACALCRAGGRVSGDPHGKFSPVGRGVFWHADGGLSASAAEPAAGRRDTGPGRAAGGGRSDGPAARGLREPSRGRRCTGIYAGLGRRDRPDDLRHDRHAEACAL